MWASRQIKQEDVQSLVQDSGDFALTHGLVLRYSCMSRDTCVAQAPATLFPSAIPRRLYQQSLDIHPIFGELMLKIANDTSFIEDTLSKVAQVDDFTNRLLQINRTVQKEGLAQPIMSCINRSDYMLDQFDESNKGSFRLRQVEINAIASGMPAQSYNAARAHRFIMSKYKVGVDQGLTFPENESLKTVAQGIIDAHNAYGRAGSHILFIMEDRSFNFSDHLFIELEVLKHRPDLNIVRRKFFNLDRKLKLGPNKELILEQVKEISLVYYRYGYDPSNYNYDTAWETRLLIERSRAIKCPSVNFHLSGAKKFQQVLNTPEQLGRFLNEKDAERISNVYCKFWPIEADTELGEEGFRVGQTNDNVVLKPQREGGGHNIYGIDVKPFLASIRSPEERSQYILMELIKTPHEKNWIFNLEDDASKSFTKFEYCDKIVSELGIYGGILAEGSRLLENRVGGYLVRSKKYGVMEGGVAAGHSGLSSLLVYDDSDPNLDLSLYYHV